MLLDDATKPGWSIVERLKEDATNVIGVPARLEKVTSRQIITALLVCEGRILLSLCVDIASIQVVQHTPVHEKCHVTTMMEQPAPRAAFLPWYWVRRQLLLRVFLCRRVGECLYRA